VNAYFLMLDLLKASGAQMYFEAVPELMRAFELPKREAIRIVDAWTMRENAKYFERRRLWMGRDETLTNETI
jgi:hypothetical protein